MSDDVDFSTLDIDINKMLNLYSKKLNERRDLKLLIDNEQNKGSGLDSQLYDKYTSCCIFLRGIEIGAALCKAGKI